MQTTLDDPTNAFCHENHAALPGSGSGPLKGLRFAAKDVIDIAGATTGFGNPDWLLSHEPARETAEVVRRLLEAGADLVGKTQTDELAYSLSGENAHYGTPINPRAPTRIPGGSSNGSASAVAAGVVDFALGTDCGGSVRLPASYCGIFGIRPTHGRLPVHGVLPFGPSFDVVGWFTRDAMLLRKVGTVLLRPPAPTPSARRMLIARDAFALVDGPVSKALAPALDAVSALLGEPEVVEVSSEGLEQWRQVFRVIQAAEVWVSLGGWVTDRKPRLGPGVRDRLEAASGVTAAEAADARLRRDAIVARLDALLSGGAVLCLPTSPQPAPARGLPMAAVEVGYRNRAMALLCIAGLGGLPQVSLPLAEVDGLPVGLSLVGGRGADEMLLDLAAALYGFGMAG